MFKCSDYEGLMIYSIILDLQYLLIVKLTDTDVDDNDSILFQFVNRHKVLIMLKSFWVHFYNVSAVQHFMY